VTHHISLSGQYIMHALVLLCINQHTKFELPNIADYKYMIGQNLKYWSRDTDHAPIRGGLSSLGWDIYVRNGAG